jgi:Domain of unknown function (DUF1931)
MPVFGVAKFERFYRAAAGLDVDKEDLKRHQDFVYEKLYGLLLIGQITAKANNREVLEEWDLPITKGLQELINEFGKIDADVELEPILQYLAARPPLDVVLSEEAEGRLVPIIGGVSLALVLTFKTIAPEAKTPMPEHWERAQRIFDLLL